MIQAGLPLIGTGAVTLRRPFHAIGIGFRQSGSYSRRALGFANAECAPTLSPSG
jgi:hypothetical protein